MSYNRQDYLVQTFKNSNPSMDDRKVLFKQFAQFVKPYGHKITSRQAERILNMYNWFADLSKYTKRRKKLYVQVLQ